MKKEWGDCANSSPQLQVIGDNQKKNETLQSVLFDLFHIIFYKQQNTIWCLALQFKMF